MSKPTSTLCMDNSPKVNDVLTLQPQVNEINEVFISLSSLILIGIVTAKPCRRYATRLGT